LGAQLNAAYDAIGNRSQEAILCEEARKKLEMIITSEEWISMQENVKQQRQQVPQDDFLFHLQELKELLIVISDWSTFRVVFRD
jgi:hypothetical protein